MIRKCKYCGKYFDTASWTRVTCGREECLDTYRQECLKKFGKEEQERVRTIKVSKDQLLKDAKAAKDLGVSYGYYMALYKGRNVV